jgi:hypothetical protein
VSAVRTSDTWIRWHSAAPHLLQWVTATEAHADSDTGRCALEAETTVMLHTVFMVTMFSGLRRWNECSGSSERTLKTRQVNAGDTLGLKRKSHSI